MLTAASYATKASHLIHLHDNNSITISSRQFWRQKQVVIFAAHVPAQILKRSPTGGEERVLAPNDQTRQVLRAQPYFLRNLLVRKFFVTNFKLLSRCKSHANCTFTCDSRAIAPSDSI